METDEDLGEVSPRQYLAQVGLMEYEKQKRTFFKGYLFPLENSVTDPVYCDFILGILLQ